MLIAIVQRVERDVFFKVIGQAAQVSENPGHPFLLREQVRRQ